VTGFRRFADEEGLRAIRARLNERLGDDFAVVMSGGVDVIGRGMDGLIGAFRDWTAPYVEYTVEWEEVVDGGDRVVVFVRQIGVIAESGLQVNARSGVVFAFEGGRLVRMEFHLDRDEALRSAGLADDA
jgi:ketosteroid isomerase-like protein